jgi:hypothetical protein
MPTRREEIFMVLKKERRTAQELANYYKVELWEIIEDLKHLAKSVRPSFELRMFPACCKKCRFIFKERSKIKSPSKCPRCKSMWIQAPLFEIVNK